MKTKNKQHEDKAYPIETLTSADGYVLVYLDASAPQNAGIQPFVLARKSYTSRGEMIEPMFARGSYQGAKWWRPVPAL